MNLEEELRRLKALVKAQDETAKSLRSELAVAHNRIRDLQAQASARYQRISFHDPIRPDQTTEIEALKAALVDARYHVNDIKTSLSWKVTAPLRGLGKILAKR